MPFLKNGGQRGDMSCFVGLALRARQLRFGQIAFVPLPFTGADKLTATTAWRQKQFTGLFLLRQAPRHRVGGSIFLREI